MSGDGGSSLLDEALAFAEWSPFFVVETPIKTSSSIDINEEPTTIFEEAFAEAFKKHKEQQAEEEEEASTSSSMSATSSSKHSQQVIIDDNWVKKKCKEVLKESTILNDVSSALVNSLLSSKSDNELQGEMMDVIGITNSETFELISSLLSQRKSLQDWKKKLQKKKKLQIQSENNNNNQKQQRGVPHNLLEKLREGCEFASQKKSSSAPEGTKRFVYETHEEVYVPPAIQKSTPNESELVPISAFDDWARTAFEGYSHLNRVQSKLFEAAYHGNGNILVCAPTGAGKTNIALMTILHEIGRHMNGGFLRKGDFKIVYVAPMKALAQEITRTFERRLSSLGVTVKELTGDMQLTKKEIGETQVIVTTPEKWDVVTRKSNDSALAELVRLLILDEVHLLNEDRGPVLEMLVARTLRMMEKTQAVIRIVGLSATLPNYNDVGHFLSADPNGGVFYFDGSYRPVPLSMRFIGVKEHNQFKSKEIMNNICFDKVVETLKKGHQVMVFVHSRKETVSTARKLIELSQIKGMSELFDVKKDTPAMRLFVQQVNKSRNHELQQLFVSGFAMHNAGMLRHDRTLVERLFVAGAVKVLVCTATLAWGINCPAHTVIIKGTEIYNPEKGGFVELGMLDIMQMFGRAGRPQYDKSGEGIIITDQSNVFRYLALLTNELPIESQLVSHLVDHLNAEIVLGTVTNIREAVSWLSYTYLYIRMMKNPLAYGITWDELEADPLLEVRRRDLVCNAALKLDSCQMIRFDEPSGNLAVANFGRVASHYYIQHESMNVFREKITQFMTESDLLSLVCSSSEFENLRFREDEAIELDNLSEYCPYPMKGVPEETQTKVNILFQAFLSHARLESFTLIMDSAYIIQNITRIFRGLFEMALNQGWCSVSRRLLTLCKMADRQLWDSRHPLCQFPNMPQGILSKLEHKKLDIEKILDMNSAEVGSMVDSPHSGNDIKRFAYQFPSLEVSATIQPITRTVLKVHLTIEPNFEWVDKIHGSAEPWWIWVEDTDNEHLYHQEYFVLTKKQYQQSRNKGAEPIVSVFTIPIFDPLPSQYYIRVISDRWLGAETIVPLSFKKLILPHQYPPHTDLLDLLPLPLSALSDKNAEKIFNFSHFNPIQTQVFHVLYHTNFNVLLGAPTGSGKTVAGELAALKVFRDMPGRKVVYIAPLKALVRERMSDWGEKFGRKLGKRIVELTGDFTPDSIALKTADILTTTPEKWDGISRSWKTRSYVRNVALVIIDEIHMLGEERGPVLEVIVSRMRYISSQTDMPIRLIGLSTAIANAQDLVEWMGVPPQGLFNFRPAVRPVPLEIHIEGFPGKNYCPLMASMNKPTYAAIEMHSSSQPTLVFVSSRRQTRLTANDLIALSTTEDRQGSGKSWLHMTRSELDSATVSISDTNLRQILPFGIGIHHAGLCDEDRAIVEKLFRENKIQILVTTSTLAYGINTPAHLVVVKGCQFYDGGSRKYVDYPVTDILQMMGRAGRPQYDQQGIAVILVGESKKDFYKKFLYEPFPVESSLIGMLHDHFNAEIVSGTINTRQDAIDYLTWTYFFRRLLRNPSYYGLESNESVDVSAFLSRIVDDTLDDLRAEHCLENAEIENEDEIGNEKLVPTVLGKIASFYYLHYTTVGMFKTKIKPDFNTKSLLWTLCSASEYDELPVRHCEDELNESLSSDLKEFMGAPSQTTTDRYQRMDDPHVKALLLLQAHFSRIPLPINDYITDTKSVMDQSIRIIQAMIDIIADQGWLFACLETIHLLEQVCQGCWLNDSSLINLPFITRDTVKQVESALGGISSMCELLNLSDNVIEKGLKKTQLFSDSNIQQILKVIHRLPAFNVKWEIKQSNKEQQQQEETKELIVDFIPQSSMNSLSSFAYAPRFPKPKKDAWIIIVGCPKTGELLALHRVALNKQQQQQVSLSFQKPTNDVKVLNLYIMSDTYIGLNQQYEINLSH